MTEFRLPETNTRYYIQNIWRFPVESIPLYVDRLGRLIEENHVFKVTELPFEANHSPELKDLYKLEEAAVYRYCQIHRLAYKQITGLTNTSAWLVVTVEDCPRQWAAIITLATKEIE